MAEPAHTGRLHSGIEHPGSRSSEGPLARAADAKAEQQRFTAAMLCEAYGQGRRDFRNLDLTGADLAGADLADAVFDGSTLKDVCLAQAKLANASFVGTLGLQAAQLAGANLAGANLPRETVDFDAPLEVVKEASKNARTLFLGMLAACAYVCITVAKSTDANLILGDTSSHLPIVGTNIPIVAFFYAAPLLLLGVYLYFQLYLQRLYERTASLPAFLPDGRALDTAIYPWLLAGIVRRHLPLLRQAQPSYATLQVILSVLLGWFVVPMTVGQIWGRALAKHDAWLTGVHIVVFAVLCTLAERGVGAG